MIGEGDCYKQPFLLQDEIHRHPVEDENVFIYDKNYIFF